ncbi:MAG: type IX secretion system membrane protein PorP/SprF [Bacteroidales bacterium]|nr:type IX secretion system membrane protein PorP/SprF [Bacteroidales bacterium]
MLKHLIQTLLLIAVISAGCFGQGIDPGPDYQMVLMNNPALSGGEGNGVLRLSYLNFYPGNNYNLHSGYLSYDSYFPSLHGGAGAYISNDYLGGIVNDLRGGLSYAYFLQAGHDLFINAGLSASFFHRGYNFNKAVLPDQIDPLGGMSVTSAEMLVSSGHTVFDIGTGVVFISGKISGGLSINHLVEPDLSGTGFSNERLKRKYFMHLIGDINLNRTKSLKARPLSFTEIQGRYLSAGAGVVIESNYLSFNAILLGNNGKNLNMQAGFSLKTSRVYFFYNYQFNIVSGNTFMPLSLLHQTGLAFSLINVDKRKIIKTINFPNL